MAGPATELGLDRSGNGNNFTVAGTLGSDQMVDTPTNNFATLDPTWQAYFTDNYGYSIISEGNLRADSVGNVNKIHMQKSTFRMVGKVYFEAIAVTQYYQIAGFGTFNWIGSSGINDGAGNAAEGANLYVNDGDEVFSYRQGGDQVNSSVNFATINANDVMQFAYDEDSGKGWVGINNTWYAADAGNDGDPAAGNNPTVTITAANRGDIFPGGSDWASGNSTASGLIYNFGQDSSFAGKKTAQGNQDGGGIGDFYYTPPTGFKAMCTSNLSATVVPSENFNTVLYTGTGSEQNVTGVGFQPDLTWIKERAESEQLVAVDVLRGSGVTEINPNSNAAESDDAQEVKAILSDGFQVGTSSVTNQNNAAHVAWNWKANGSGSSNSSGDITSTVSANTSSGFSIVTYTGNSSGGATFGHGLSKAPELVIIKGRNVSDNWVVWVNDSIRLLLNGVNANIGNHPISTSSTLVTTPSSVDNAWNGSYNYLAYCFHSVEGFSSIGTYTGNGSTNGTFLYTGFRPMWGLFKNITDSNTSWILFDTKRSTFNPADDSLSPDTGYAEEEDYDVDFLSNGFKFRNTSSWSNLGGKTYIYMAFAEMPFKYTTVRQ